MINRLLVLFVFILSIQFIVLLPICSAENRLQIGATSALTGPASTYGTDIKNLLLFANHELAKDKYEIVIEDDRCNPKEAVTIAHRFVSVNKLPYIIGFPCSGTSLAVAPILEKSKVVLMTYGSAPAISHAGDYIFRTRASDEFGLKLLYEHFKSTHRRLGVIVEQTDYAVDTAKTFQKLNNTNTIELIEENYISDSDLRPILLRLKQKAVDGIFIVLQTELTMINALKQMKELKLELPIYGSNAADSPTLLNIAGSTADGLVVFGQPEVPDSLSPEGKLLYERFIKQYGPMRGMKLVFLTSMLAFDALHRAISSGENVKEYLYNNKFGGVFGEFSFDKNGDIIGLPFVLKKVTNGKFEELKTPPHSLN